MMQNFLRLATSDVRYGLFQAMMPRLLMVAGVSAVVFFLSYVVVLVQLPDLQGHTTLGENLLALYRGALPYTPQPGKPFQFPMQWFALLIVMCYVASDYPFRDLGGMGARMIVAAGSRWSWWLAKCYWVVTCALTCFLVPVVLAVAISVFTAGGWDIGVRPGVAAMLRSGSADTLASAVGIQTSQVTWQVPDQPLIPLLAPLATVMLALMAVMFVETFVSLLVNPVIGLMTAVALLFFSAYFRVWWLPGQYLMLARYDTLTRAGVNTVDGTLISLGVCAFVVIVGGVIFSQRDIMGRERDDA